MRNEQREMLAAVDDIEAAAQQLAAAMDRHRRTFRVVSRAAHPDANRQHTLNDRIGTVVYGLLVQRLRGLGLDPLLKQARTIGSLDETWVHELQARIREFVR
jgi:hypothetical protein